MKTQRMTNESGSLLLIVLLVILLFTGLIVGVVFEPISSTGAYSEQTGQTFGWGQGWLCAVHTDVRHTSRKIKHTAALYLAEAGSEHAKQYLSSLASPPTTPQTITAATVLGASSVNLGSGSYDAQIVVSSGAFGIPNYTITSTGTVVDTDPYTSPGLKTIKRTIVVKAILGSFARYAYFTNTEPTIWFTTQDALLGLVHTNGTFHLSGKPDFWGLASQVGSTFTYYNSGYPLSSSNPSNPPTDVPNFRDGYKLSAPNVPYPTSTTDIEAAAQGSQGIVVNGKSEITLSVGAGNVGEVQYAQDWHDPVTHTHAWVGTHDGIYHSTNYSQTHTHPGYYAETYNTTVYDGETNPGGKAVIYVNGDAEVSGTLAGQFTILTKGDIKVTDNIAYHVNPVDYDGDGLLSDANDNGVNDPHFDRDGDGKYDLPGEAADDTDDNGDGIPDAAGYDQPESTDTLGLVAKGDVIVADDDGPAINRNISGSIMALGTSDNLNGSVGSFRVEDYSSHLEGVLTVVGGIVQKTRGAVGQGIAPRTGGYSKNYIYDKRLLYYPPPYFPPAKAYDLIYWREVPQ
jgi:hypothetical protein